jgi:hypothetical protein
MRASGTDGDGAEGASSRPIGGLSSLGQRVRRAAGNELVTPACPAVFRYLVSRLPRAVALNGTARDEFWTERHADFYALVSRGTASSQGSGIFRTSEGT